MDWFWEDGEADYLVISLFCVSSPSPESPQVPADRTDVPFEQVLEGRFIIGSPDECVNEIKKYQELGIQELILRCQWPGMPNQDSNRAVKLFGREVLPRFG